MENYLEAMMILERPKVADEMDTTGATLDAFYMNYNIDLSPPSTGSNGSGGSDDNKNYQQNSELCVAFCVSLSGMELLTVASFLKHNNCVLFLPYKRQTLFLE